MKSGTKDEKTRGVRPEKAIKILKKHGTNMSFEEAEIMLDLMYKFTKLAVNQLLASKKRL